MNIYYIKYANLKDTDNPNPIKYQEEDLPIVLKPLNKNGYEFIGWLDEQEKIITKVDTIEGGNRFLYAMWQEKGYLNLEYNSNLKTNVTNMPEDTTVEYGDNYKITNMIPNAKGYIFLNWSNAPTGSGIKYYPNEIIENIKENIKLFAIWYKLPQNNVNCCNGDFICICCGCRKKLNEIIDCKCKKCK